MLATVQHEHGWHHVPAAAPMHAAVLLPPAASKPSHAVHACHAVTSQAQRAGGGTHGAVLLGVGILPQATVMNASWSSGAGTVLLLPPGTSLIETALQQALGPLIAARRSKIFFNLSSGGVVSCPPCSPPPPCTEHSEL